MTCEQAKSELMQIYMSLSEEKKQALDVLMAQNCDQCEVGNPCLYCKHEFKAQADRNEFYNWDAPIRHKADGEYISKDTAIDDITTGLCEEIACSECPFDKPDIICKVQKWLRQLPSVAIPPEHDGCKDCRYQDKGEDELPCCECQQNYKDKWEAKANKVGHWEVMYEPKNMVVCSKCGKCAYLYKNRGSAYCPHCGDYKGGELNG